MLDSSESYRAPQYLQCCWHLQSFGFEQFSPQYHLRPCGCRLPKRGDSPPSPASSWTSTANGKCMRRGQTTVLSWAEDLCTGLCVRTWTACWGVRWAAEVEGVSLDVRRPCRPLQGCQQGRPRPQRRCFLSRCSCGVWGPTGWRSRSAQCCNLQGHRLLSSLQWLLVSSEWISCIFWLLTEHSMVELPSCISGFPCWHFDTVRQRPSVYSSQDSSRDNRLWNTMPRLILD